MSNYAITPYLMFSGRCEEALEFYRRELGAEIEMVMKFNQSPEPVPAGMLQPGFEQKVMHSSFRVNGAQVMASDGCDDKSKFDGFRLVISVETPEQARKAFDALAKGGQVDMPLGKTFFSPCYGMVTDRFHVPWMVIVPGQNQIDSMRISHRGI